MAKAGGFLYKIRKTITKPFWVVYRTIFPLQYRAEKYWTDRLSKYGLDLRGVGNWTLSSDENEKKYLEAKNYFLDFCKKERLDFKGAHVLDIGCGTGFYTNILKNEGVSEYTGIDITDALFSKLQKKYPDFTFIKADISKSFPKGSFDFVLMIDVTQHIVDDRMFSSAMKNISSVLSEKGIFIVTSWLSPCFVQRQPHEVARSMEYYTREFPDCSFSEPSSFRDKYLFTVRKIPSK
ncbi:MAG: class I SAM-dependent methyltransferase [Sedimentisphaerales bacterium]|nr:class I SAM-dependent methyltransferase [Sedimentisphaerales bacterium]